MKSSPFNHPFTIYPQNANQSATRLFIYAEARSGSTWLVDTLNSNSEISLLNEIFNPDFLKDYLSKQQLRKMATEKGSYPFAESLLNGLVGKFTGCKVLFPQAIRFMDFYEFLMNYRRSYFIVIERKNSILAEVSGLIAQKHGRWHLTENHAIQPVAVEPCFLYERLLWRKYAKEFCCNMLKAFCENLFFMDYESLFTDIPGSLSKISAFLNLSSDAFNWSAEVKSNPFPLENLIHNYAEVVAFFKDKPEFFAMLE